MVVYLGTDRILKRCRKPEVGARQGGGGVGDGGWRQLTSVQDEDPWQRLRNCDKRTCN
jgi:hypothetical protein